MKVDDKLLKKSISAAIEFSIIKKEGFKDKNRKFDESLDFVINLKDINLSDPKQRIDKEIIHVDFGKYGLTQRQVRFYDKNVRYLFGIEKGKDVITAAET